jgi:hypothetical protein
MKPCRRYDPPAIATTVALAAALAAGGLRAGEPQNPLRTMPLGESAKTTLSPLAESPSEFPLAIDPAPLPPPSAGPLEAPSELPPSIVPPAFGQPKLLPQPPTLGGPPDAELAPPIWEEPAWQHLVHPWFDEPWFSHSDPNDPHRHRGLGQPLVGTSWRNRPWFAGAFVGGVMMNDLLPNHIYQNDTSFVGARLGLDFDHYWGMEGRWAFARPELTMGDGTPLPDPSRDYFADVSLVYYPFGDARWRPYLLAGLGFQTFRFNNDLGQRISEAALEVPLGFGVKYFYGPWFTLRFDFADNLAVGNARVSGMHNISLMAGAEFRFGGRRPSYFPWHNNTTYF